MPEVTEFAICKRCQEPFPLFADEMRNTRCPPCRKRRRAHRQNRPPELTAGDLAFEAIHGFYSLRDSAWRQRLIGMEATISKLTGDAGDLSDENVRLREDNARLLEQNDEMCDHLAKKTNAIDEVPKLKRQIMDLSRRLNTSQGSVQRMARELSIVRGKLQNAQAANFQAMFAKSQDLELPDGLTLKELIKLCHPDRHNGGANEESAVLAFKWLMEKVTAERKAKKRGNQL